MKPPIWVFGDLSGPGWNADPETQMQVMPSGGFATKRNLIPDLLKVDWSDTQRQNEFVGSVVSALNGLGEKLDYDYVCAVSGSAFRT